MKLIKILVLTVVICSKAFPQNEIKIITYNILEGFGNEASYGEGRHGRGVQWLKEQNADVIALQEMYSSEEQLLKDAKKWGHDYFIKNGSLALTSNQPIILKKNFSRKNGFWHGVIHCETYGIDFLAIHLSPADWKYRLRETEMIKEIVDSIKLKTSKYMVLGDFNSHSPLDAELHEQNPGLLQKYKKADKKSKEKGNSYRNLANNNHDYSVMSRFLSFPLVDISQRYVPLHNRFTFPSPILIGSWRTAGSIGRTPERIDYMMTSMELSNYCKSVKIHNVEANDYISDHYPVEAIFEYSN